MNIANDDETADGLVKEFDMDGDGEIDYREFVQRIHGRRAMRRIACVRERK